MKKVNETAVKINTSSPIKSPSPDFKTSNMIRSTKTPGSHSQQVESYVSKKINQTPEGHINKRKWETPKPQKSTNFRYFSSNHAIQQSSPSEFYHQEVYSSGSNDEVILQLKRIIQMINNNKIQSDSLSPQNSRVKEQVRILQIENNKLLDLIEKLNMKLGTKNNLKCEALESQLIVLRQQLNKNISLHEKDKEQLYRTNQTLTIQIKSLEDRRLYLEKQNQNLKQFICEKEQQEKLRQSQTLRKTQQKMSLALIKDQYNESLKTLKQKLAFDINYHIEGYEQKIKQTSSKLYSYEERIHNLQVMKIKNRQLQQTINGLNHQIRVLSEKVENKALKAQAESLKNELFIISQKYNTILNEKVSQQRTYLEKLNEQELSTISKLKALQDIIQLKDSTIENLNSQIVKLGNQKDQNTRLQDQIYQLTKRLSEKQTYFIDLETKTESKVNQLVQNYEREIKILKQEIQNKNSRALHLSGKQAELEQQIIYLKEQLDNCRTCNLRQTQSYEKRIAELQIIINSHTIQMKQMQEKILEQSELEKKVNEHTVQISRLMKIIAKYQEGDKKLNTMESQIMILKSSLGSKSEDLIRLSQELRMKSISEDEMKFNYENELGLLKKQIEEAEAKQRMISGVISHDTMIQQLNQLKILISQSQLGSFQTKFLALSESYERQLIKNDEIVRQIEKLRREKSEFQEKSLQEQKSKIIYEEKIKVLEQNLKLFEKELRDKKQISDQLINQKMSLERQVIMIKKIKLDQDNIQIKKINSQAISEKIDYLLQIQQKREKKMSQLPYSSVIQIVKNS